MDKKIIYGILALIIIVSVVAWSINSYTPGEGNRAEVKEEGEKEIRTTSVETIKEDGNKLEIEGFSVGKSHILTFDEWSAEILKEEDRIVGFNGFIEPDTVNTGIGGLDNHLKNEDFFDVEQHTEIIFETTKIEGDLLYGNLKFLGVTKEISFPINISEEGISSEFYLDTEPFGMKYTGVNKEVRVSFELKN